MLWSRWLCWKFGSKTPHKLSRWCADWAGGSIIPSLDKLSRFVFFVLSHYNIYALTLYINLHRHGLNQQSCYSWKIIITIFNEVHINLHYPLSVLGRIQNIWIFIYICIFVLKCTHTSIYEYVFSRWCLYQSRRRFVASFLLIRYLRSHLFGFMRLVSSVGDFFHPFVHEPLKPSQSIFVSTGFIPMWVVLVGTSKRK